MTMLNGIWGNSQGVTLKQRLPKHLMDRGLYTRASVKI